MAPLATPDNTGDEMRDAVIAQVGEWLRTEQFPHVHIWPLTDYGRALYISLGKTEAAAKSGGPDEKITLNFRVSYEERNTDGELTRIMTGLLGYPPMRVMNYAKNRSSSYVRPGAYASSPIPPGLKPQQLIQWLTQAPPPVAARKVNKVNPTPPAPKPSPSGPSF